MNVSMKKRLFISAVNWYSYIVHDQFEFSFYLLHLKPKSLVWIVPARKLRFKYFLHGTCIHFNQPNWIYLLLMWVNIIICILRSVMNFNFTQINCFQLMRIDWVRYFLMSNGFLEEQTSICDPKHFSLKFITFNLTKCLQVSNREHYLTEIVWYLFIKFFRNAQNQQNANLHTVKLCFDIIVVVVAFLQGINTLNI